MSLPGDRAHERRQSYRCPVPEPRQQATLKVRRRRIPVQLFNESSGGFAVWADHDPGLEIDDLAQLLTDAGSFIVRVAYLEKVLPQPGQAASGDWGFRLGLERLREGALSGEEQRRANGRGRASTVGQVFPSALSQASLGVLFTLVIAIALIGATSTLLRSHHSLARYFLDWRNTPALGAPSTVSNPTSQ